jgi:hypothetical protein
LEKSASSCGVPIIYPSFSHHFPIIFPSSSNHFPIIFHAILRGPFATAVSAEVSLREWVDRRIGGEVATKMGSNGQAACYGVNG